MLCDTFPWYGLRLRHGLFVIPSEHLQHAPSESGRRLKPTRFELAKGIIDQYYTEEFDVVDALLEPLLGTSSSVRLLAPRHLAL